MHITATKWWIPAILGFFSGLLVLSSALVMWSTIVRMQVAVSDFVFLADDGPRLGRLPASDQVVLVLYDETSRKAMGQLPTYDDDLLLYKDLLDAGASIVADVRMIADGGGEEAKEVHEFLEKLVATNSTGKLFRDIWIASQLPAEFAESVEPYIANNLLNMHPNSDSYYEARVYPLAMMFGKRFRESMPLILARVAQGEDRLPSAQVLEQLKSSGISAAWQESLPAGLNLTQDLRADGIEKTTYPCRGVDVPWLLFSTNSPSILPVGYWVSYSWSPADFKRISYTEASKSASPEQFDGKIVLIGYEGAIDPSSDTYPVPNHPQRAAAAAVLACALQTLLQPHIMVAVPVAVGCATVLGLSVAGALVGGLMKPIHAGVVLLAIAALWFLLAVLAYRAGWFIDLALTPLALVLAGSLGAGYRYLGEIRWRLRIVDLFGRYVPRAVVTQLVQQPDVEALAMGGIKREVTVLFADIRNFTPFAERVPPEQVIEQLNSLLQIFVDCTFANEGTVDKFIGDAILVLFNAPLDQSDHVQRAARTALAMQQGIAKHASGLQVGIGIHRGEAVVGRVGTPERMEYTAVGSTVNVASRLCSAAPSGTIVVSDAVAESLQDTDFVLTAQPPLRVKGVEAELQTYLLSGQ